MPSEYLLRVKPSREGGFSASIRRFTGTQHPEVRCVIGPVVYGAGATEAAAMVAAVAQVHLGQVTVREVPRHGC